MGVIISNIWSIVLFLHLKPYTSGSYCLDHRKVCEWFTIALRYSESIETFWGSIQGEGHPVCSLYMFVLVHST